MSLRLSAAFCSLAILLGCSHLKDTRRVPASEPLSKSYHEIVLFYEKDGVMFVRNCRPDANLDHSLDDLKKDCTGNSSKIPAHKFWRFVKNEVGVHKLNKFNGQKPEQIKAASLELDRINSFLLKYGPESGFSILNGHSPNETGFFVRTVKSRNEKVLRSLGSPQALVRQIKKIEAELDLTIKLLSESSNVNVLKFDTSEENALFSVLRNVTPTQRFSCGLEGSVEERIKNCSLQKSQFNTPNGNFILVSILEEKHRGLKEVILDKKTNLLWDDVSTLGYRINFYQANSYCEQMAKASGLNWRLPTKYEVEEAMGNGAIAGLPNMQGLFFWTSTRTNLRPVNHATETWILNDKGGFTSNDTLTVIDDLDYMPRYNSRCVTEI